MKNNILSSLIALGIYLTPLTLTIQPGYSQTENRQTQIEQLTQQAQQQTQQGKPLEAIKTLQQVLTIARQNKIKDLEAWALLGLGLNYNIIGQPQQALDNYNSALAIFRELNNRFGEANTLNNIGQVYNSIGNPTEALNYYQQALPISRELNNRIIEANTLDNIGEVYRSIGKPTEALNYYQQASPIFKEVGDRRGEATILNNIGLVYHNIGKPTEALNYFQQALLITREVSYRIIEATILNNIGEVYSSIGKPTEALNYFQQALLITREVGDRRGEAATLNNIGGVYHNIGKPTEALNYLHQALPIRREVGDRSEEATTLNNIGSVYYSMGNPTEALNYYQQALLIKKEVGDRSGEAGTLSNIGSVYDSIGKPAEALNYYQQALSIKKEVGDRSGEAGTLNNIGFVYNSIGKPTEALNYYQQALSITKEVGYRSGEATALNNIGFVYRSIGKPTEALNYYQKALPITKEVGDRSGEATTLSNIGSVYRDTNQPEKAISYLEESVKITLEIRKDLSREHRKQFIEVNKGTAYALIDLLIKQKQPEKAFEYANLVTTFDLADYTRLINAKVNDPKAQKAIDQWNEKNQQLQYLRQQLEKEFNKNLALNIREVEAETYKLAENIINQYPDVAELFETNPTNIKQLRQNIPPDTVVIQPVFLTNIDNVPNSIALFLLTNNNLSVIQTQINASEVEELINQYQTQLEKRQRGYNTTGAKLYNLFIRPAQNFINTNHPKNIAIIATGKLRNIPFEPLYDEEKNQILIQQYPIYYLTRISSGRPIRSHITISVEPQTIIIIIAGFAACGLLVWLFRKYGIITSSIIIVSLAGSIFLFINVNKYHNVALALANPKPTKVNLPGTEAEAKHLQQNFPGTQIYINEQATLDNFKTYAAKFPILHLGTHGCFLPDGCKSLAMEANTILFANNQQFPLADAALLGLEKTELIALSACQTAKEITIENPGLAGLAYVLERAGSKSVLASLWNTEDEATSQIMIDFYDNIKKGMSKSEAMQKAKLKQIDHHPWFWSPFILIGN